ncbi:Deoxycytidine monophosphate (dCMP) deaminase [Aspergillus hancockii]|nr:Deoxycytidine monophosphate (dCMP) deaminase [Aspergillus hancockii]
MLIGLCGGICSGKHAIAEYLIQHQGFQLLELKTRSFPQIADAPEDDRWLQASEFTNSERNQSSQLLFESAESLLNFATKRWQGFWVTTDIWEETTLDRFLQRPFFLLVSVDAPVSLRWKRFAARCRSRQLEPPPLEKFVFWNDRHLYDKNIGRAYLTDRAQVRLFDSSSSVGELHAALKALNLADEERLRPNWDQYFMQLASLAAQRSNCMKRRVGCVLVRERRVISTGYNGTPRHVKNCNEGGFKIAQVGISEVVYSQGYNMDQDVYYPLYLYVVDFTDRNQSAEILEAAGVRLRQFSPPRNGLIYLEGTNKCEQ